MWCAHRIIWHIHWSQHPLRRSEVRSMKWWSQWSYTYTCLMWRESRLQWHNVWLSSISIQWSIGCSMRLLRWHMWMMKCKELDWHLLLWLCSYYDSPCQVRKWWLSSQDKWCWWMSTWSQWRAVKEFAHWLKSDALIPQILILDSYKDLSPSNAAFLLSTGFRFECKGCSSPCIEFPLRSRDLIFYNHILPFLSQ